MHLASIQKRRSCLGISLVAKCYKEEKEDSPISCKKDCKNILLFLREIITERQQKIINGNIYNQIRHINYRCMNMSTINKKMYCVVTIL